MKNTILIIFFTCNIFTSNEFMECPEREELVNYRAEKNLYSLCSILSWFQWSISATTPELLQIDLNRQMSLWGKNIKKEEFLLWCSKYGLNEKNRDFINIAFENDIKKNEEWLEKNGKLWRKKPLSPKKNESLNHNVLNDSIVSPPQTNTLNQESQEAFSEKKKPNDVANGSMVPLPMLTPTQTTSLWEKFNLLLPPRYFYTQSDFYTE
jgi:hypothetical protein